MDINSLLSPQEASGEPPNLTAATKPPAKKPRKSRTSKVAQPSPLANTTLPPPTLPHNAVVQAQHGAVSPSTMSPSSGNRLSATTTPPADGSHTKRQPSTPGMDTLADLASMQHHQQTARANAGGLRSDVIYENPTSSASVLPNLRTMPRPRASSQLRGGSFDVNMSDGPASTPSRRLSTSALSEEELQVVAQSIEYLSSNPFAYESHLQLINLLHRGLLNYTGSQSSSAAPNDAHAYDLLQDLQNARQVMNSRFAMGEDLWADWIDDQILLARSLEDRISIMELCQKAVDEESNSTKLWLKYGYFMLSLYKNANPHDQKIAGIREAPTSHEWSEEDRMMAKEVFTWPQVINVWERGTQETSLRLSDSHLVWDTYTELLLLELASSSSQELIARINYHFITRLQTPHATWDQTFQAYSNFISQYDNASYEYTMVTANRLGAEAKDKYSRREMFEVAVSRASERADRDAELKAYSDYVEWELGQSHKKNAFDFPLTSALYQRAVLRFPASTQLWEGYAMLLYEEIMYRQPEGISVHPVLERATRHCPWSGTLWSQHLLAAETSKLPYSDIEDIKHKATSSGLLDAGGMEEVLKINTAWCGFLRRRAFLQDSTDEEMDVAEVGIRSAIEDMETTGRQKYGKDYQGDPEYRLEKIYIKYLTQSRNWDSARKTWTSLIPQRGDSYDFWIRYYIWEMNTWSTMAYNESSSSGIGVSKPVEATKVLQQAMKRPKLDWPEKIIELYQYHCEDNEDAQELQSSLFQVWKAKRIVQKRREKEALEAYEAAQAGALQQQLQAQQDVTAANGDSGHIGKRKREADLASGDNKKMKPAVAESTEPPVEEQQSSVPSLLKRDRENATVVVKNLPVSTTEQRLRQYFRDCGTINNLKLIPEADGLSTTASIEFDSKEDVLTAQTKDMKSFDGNSIEVKVGSGSTLYVCNFPPTADEPWIREKFQKYGEIVDIRFPSLRFNAHRRFCYVQFKSSRDAQAATELDGRDVGGELKLLAKISDPTHKQGRHGPLYEGREVYLANLAWTATKADVKKAFSKYGKVESVRIPTKVDGSSKGIGFVAFSTKAEAEAAFEMNLTMFKNRILNVSLATNDMAKRQANTIITSTSQRSTASPNPDLPSSMTNGIAQDMASSTPPADSVTKVDEIQSRTLALMNIPDTVNDARIRALAEPYGELVQLLLRPDHQGAILEYRDVASAGKAALGLEGQEIVPGRTIKTGNVAELKQLKAEHRIDRVVVGPGKPSAALQPAAPIRRPNQPGARRGGKGGLGVKRGGVGLSGDRAKPHGEDIDGSREMNGDAEENGKPKSNSEFKAMFLKK